ERDERLAAEARSAGAKDDDIARASREPAGSGADRGEVVTPGGQPDQRQAAVGMARAQPGERLTSARERVGEVGCRDAPGADPLRTRVLDRLDERQAASPCFAPENGNLLGRHP